MDKAKASFKTRKGRILDILIVSVIYFYVVLVCIPFRNIFLIQISATILGGFFIFYVIFISHYIHGDNWADRGFGSWKTLFIRTDNLRKSFREIFIITAFIVICIFLISLILGSYKSIQSGGFYRWLVQKGILSTKSILVDIFLKFILYCLWGFFPQILFLSFINVRLKKIFLDKTRNKKIVISLLTGIIFSCYHIFNIKLMIFTFIAGTLWAWSFYDTPNLFTVSVSHGLCGTLSSFFIFNSNNWNMKVGLPGLMI